MSGLLSEIFDIVATAIVIVLLWLRATGVLATRVALRQRLVSCKEAATRRDPQLV